jgi:hypothetical protein
MKIFLNKLKQVNKTHYKTNFARLGSFINAFSRYKMLEQMIKYKKYIVRICIDSFTVKNECVNELLKDIKLDNEMGSYKIDKKRTGNYIIRNIFKMEEIIN